MFKPGMVVYICNPSTQKAETEYLEFKASLESLSFINK
jgi:hypothetical protein